MRPNDPTITPQDIAEGYMRSYSQLYGCPPRVQHLGGEWYKVNGEMVTRTILLDEVINIRHLIKQKKKTTSKSLIHRLINKIKAI